MKYLLTYQILQVNVEDQEKIYKLNDKYRAQKQEPSQDKEVEIYKKVLPQNPGKFYLLTDKDDNLLHLQSDISAERLEEFKWKVEGKETKFNNCQANFRMVQDYAWATQFKEKPTPTSKPIALVYVHEISDDEYSALCKDHKTKKSMYDSKDELKKLEEKKQFIQEYKEKKICIGNDLPKTAKLVGIFNATTGAQNKCIIFVGGSTDESLFIESVKCALLGYEAGTVNYSKFEIPIVNLGSEVMSLSNPNQGFKEDLALVAMKNISLPNISYKDLKLDTSRALGGGSFGVVYKGEWNGQKIAFKQLRTQDISVKKEFINEVTTMAKFSACPCVIKLYGISAELPNYGVVMELMPKGSLSSVLRTSPNLSWKIRYQIAMDVTTGLRYLHDRNTVHRDLKGENVLLDDNYHAKLGDFGLARTRSTITRLSQVGTKGSPEDRSGTPPYMAPELFGPHPDYSRGSDMYSYGMILWEIATCRWPWAGAYRSIDDLGERLLKGEREAIPKNCPKSFAALIVKCWKDRNDRPKIDEAEKDLVVNELEIKNYVP